LKFTAQKSLNTNLLLIKNFITMKNFKKLSRNELKTVTAGQVWFADTSCGIQATTTQDWTLEQANAWLERLETFYCPKPTHSGPSQNLAAN
jgi:hypothetical protein